VLSVQFHFLISVLSLEAPCMALACLLSADLSDWMTNIDLKKNSLGEEDEGVLPAGDDTTAKTQKMHKPGMRGAVHTGWFVGVGGWVGGVWGGGGAGRGGLSRSHLLHWLAAKWRPCTCIPCAQTDNKGSVGPPPIACQDLRRF
jgi:hypothetical protein